MRDVRLANPKRGDPIERIEFFSRLAVSAIGLIVIFMGLYLVISLSTRVYTALGNPDEMTTVLRKWTEAVGGDALIMKAGDAKYPMAQILAVAVLGGGAFFLGWLSLSVMLTGSRMITWMPRQRKPTNPVSQGPE
jgi:hypothetical protein